MEQFYKLRKNPFQPDDIVGPKRFVGRKEEIKRGKRLFDQVIYNGRISAIRIIGERKIGKTSLATYLCSLYENTKMESDSDVVDIDYLHIDISTVNDFLDFLFLVQYKLALDIKNKGLWERYKGMFAGFGKYFLDLVNGHQTVNVNVNFSGEVAKDSPPINPLVFKENLRKYTKDRVKEGKSAFILILDNINGLVEDVHFPRFLKGMTEEFGIEERDGLPFCLILCAITERWERIEMKHAPVSRIFTEQFDLERLKDTEVEKFFHDRFSDHDLPLDNGVLSLLIGFTEGIPMFMQRIGYEVFGYVDDGNVSKSIAIQGIASAARKLSNSPIMYGKCIDSLSKRFDNVLLSDQRLKVAESDLWKKEEISRGELLERKFSKSQITQFIKYMTDNCIIKSRRKTRLGSYEFTSRMMQYLFLKRVKEESQMKGKETESLVEIVLDDDQ